MALLWQTHWREPFLDERSIVAPERISQSLEGILSLGTEERAEVVGGVLEKWDKIEAIFRVKKE